MTLTNNQTAVLTWPEPVKDIGTKNLKNLEYLVLKLDGSVAPDSSTLNASSLTGTLLPWTEAKEISKNSDGLFYTQNSEPGIKYFHIFVRDKAGNITTYSPARAPDSLAPVPGNSGAITVIRQGNNGWNITWTKAADNLTISTKLQYKLILLNTGYVSISDSETNGTVLVDWTNDLIASYTGNGLGGAIVKTIVLLVRDENLNIGVYSRPNIPDIVAPDGSAYVNPRIENNGAQDSIKLIWGQASDQSTTAANLQYLVVKKLSGTAINGDEIALGSPSGMLMNWTKADQLYYNGTQELYLTDTAAGINYYHIFVKDSADNISSYNPKKQTEYQIGGTVSGLTGSLILNNNAGDALTLNANGSFNFATKLSQASAYSVTIQTQPSGQTCSVSSGSGTVGASDVNNVSVTCLSQYSVGGGISGLSGTVVLQNNGADNLSKSSNGSFTFATSINSGSTYSVTVLTQPNGQFCVVNNKNGTLTAQISNVSVVCISQSWLTQLGTTTKATGGSNTSSDKCFSVAADSQGNVYCAGQTYGALGETAGGSGDAFILKLNSSGVIQWLTQLGSTTKATGGSNAGEEKCYGVAVDSAGNVYCAGHTTGAFGETYGGGVTDAFVLKLNSQGALQWLTHLGSTTKATGGSNAAREICLSVAVDTNGNVYCAGETTGSMGEANGGSTDTFILKLNSNGALQWLTQLGASTKTAVAGANTLVDICYGIAVDSSGNVYCAGDTNGAVGETNAGDYDAFFVKLNSLGALQWVTQLGASTKAVSGSNTGENHCRSISLDGSGNIYCGGYTQGNMGEINGGGGYDAIVVKLNSSGTLQWVKQLGLLSQPIGTESMSSINGAADACYGVAADSLGNVFCAGYTQGAMAESNAGNYDAFVVKLNDSGNIQWLTQLGASTKFTAGANTSAEECAGVALDNLGNVYCAGNTTGKLNEINAGSYDAFILKLNSGGVVNSTISGTYEVSGTVSGLSGSVVLKNNYANEITVTANGSFTFSNPISAASKWGYYVSANALSSSGQICSVGSSGGVLASANVTGITIICATPSSYCLTSERYLNAPFANSNETGIDGTSIEKAYTICTPAQFQKIKAYTTSYFKLADDIANFSSLSTFKGYLDGQNYKFYDTAISVSGQQNLGLFTSLGSSSNPATVKNLKVENVRINSDGQYVGLLAAEAQYSSISNVHATNSRVTSKGSYVGGLVGYSNLSTITNSSFVYTDYSVNSINTNDADGWDETAMGGILGRGELTGLDAVYVNAALAANYPNGGGIVGSGEKINISNALFRGEINISNQAADFGGIIGNASLATLTNSFSNCTITGGSGGGLVGRLMGNNTNIIRNNFSKCTISTPLDESSGYLFGFANNTVTNSFYSAQSAITYTGIAGTPTALGTLKATESDFYDKAKAPLSSWDFDSVWQESSGNYPVLRTLDTSTMFTIGGTFSGQLNCNSIGMFKNNSNNFFWLSTSNSTFSMTSRMATGANYNVTVQTFEGDTPNCVITNGTGTVGAANVTNVSLVCQSTCVEEN